MKNISLKKGLGYLLIFLFSLQLLASLLVFWIFSYQESLSVALNISGRQRMLTQKMTKESFIYAKMPTPDHLKQIIETANLFNKSLYALKNGSKEMMLKKLKDKNALEKWQACAQVWKEFYKHILALKTCKPGSPEFESHLSYIKDNNLRVLKRAHQFVLALQDLALKKVRETKMLLVTFVFLNLFATIGGFILVKKRIILPLDKIINAFREISKGNMNVSIKEEGVNEIRELSRVAKGMTMFIGSAMKVFKSQEGLQKEIQKIISSTTRNVLNGAEQVGALVGRVNDISLTTKDAMEAVNRSAKELSLAINEISENISRTAISINEVRDKAENASQVMERFSIHTQEIGKIVETIQKIAEETNLLALNATIEASRAGTAGRSFAVVANEIKELAQETANSAKEISDMVANIQDNVGGAVSSVNEILNSAIELSEYASTITSAVEEQNIVVKDISDRINLNFQDIDKLNKESNELKKISEHFLDIAGQLETPVESLKEIISEITHVVSLFDVSHEEVNADDLKGLPSHVILEEAYLDHLLWRSKTVQSILKGDDKTKSGKDDKCLLGQILNNSNIIDQNEVKSILQKIRKDHERLHSLVYGYKFDSSVSKRTIWLNTQLKPIFENIALNLYNALSLLSNRNI